MATIGKTIRPRSMTTAAQSLQGLATDAGLARPSDHGSSEAPAATVGSKVYQQSPQGDGKDTEARRSGKK